MNKKDKIFKKTSYALYFVVGRVFLKIPAAWRLGCFVFLMFTPLVFCAQDLPDEIRGYKVYKADVSVKTSADKTERKNKAEAFVKVGKPELVEVSLTGITFEVSSEIDSLEQSGKIDFLAFHDFRINGLAVEIEEFKESFAFKKNETLILPKPVKVFLGTGQALRGALNEFRNSKDEWTVTGRVFVFGKFKKMGFYFKRVVPVEINIKINNPLLQK